jgi:hypothetical protein
MKQAKIPKNQEGIKKEPNSGSDIPDDSGTMPGRVLETKPEVDKEEGFEDTTKDTAEVDEDTVEPIRLSSTGRKFLKPEQGLQGNPIVGIQRTGG